ncbi:MAG: 23S rRNA (guanosine(2251)-2'-O)-methyltransferase RlmB [Elusimicrobiota bacterium]|jgi:23S rRNA (guanosine2251-2'-O)-methyltransferase
MKQATRWLYGTHVVEESLSSEHNRVHELWIQRDRGRDSEELSRKARAMGAKVRWVTRKDLDRLSTGGPHQGLAVRVEAPDSGDLEAFLANLSEKERRDLILVALDQIQDPQNVGAIARSAVCLGASALLVPDRRSAGLSPGASRASAGALQKVPLFQVGNLAQTLRRLKEAGFWIYGADMSGKPAWEVSFNRPFVLVVGSEQSGMRPLVQSHCDELAAIPQVSAGGVDSINASAAAAVLLYEAFRQAHGR